MNEKDYFEMVKNCEAKNYEEIRERFTDRNIRLLHGSIGLETEAGEIADQLKKHIFYGKDLDTVNLEEEIGDMFWYCALMCDELGVDFTQIMEKNYNKLTARYKKGFTKQEALNRDLENERNILEQ